MLAAWERFKAWSCEKERKRPVLTVLERHRKAIRHSMTETERLVLQRAEVRVKALAYAAAATRRRRITPRNRRRVFVRIVQELPILIETNSADPSKISHFSIALTRTRTMSSRHAKPIHLALKEGSNKKPRLAVEHAKKPALKSTLHAKARPGKPQPQPPKITQKKPLRVAEPAVKRDIKGKAKAVHVARDDEPEHTLPVSFKIMAGSYEKLLYGIEGTVSVEDASHKYNLKPIFIFPAHMSYIRAVAASPSGGKWLATGSGDEIIKVWDLRRRKEIGGLMHHEGEDPFWLSTAIVLSWVSQGQ